ncbi:MAG: hypothetical protein AAF530_14965 [Pseudomonadota bacterium]
MIFSFGAHRFTQPVGFYQQLMGLTLCLFLAACEVRQDGLNGATPYDFRSFYLDKSEYYLEPTEVSELALAGRAVPIDRGI